MSANPEQLAVGLRDADGNVIFGRGKWEHELVQETLRGRPTPVLYLRVAEGAQVVSFPTTQPAAGRDITNHLATIGIEVTGALANGKGWEHLRLAAIRTPTSGLAGEVRAQLAREKRKVAEDEKSRMDAEKLKRAEARASTEAEKRQAAQDTQLVHGEFLLRRGAALVRLVPHLGVDEDGEPEYKPVGVWARSAAGTLRPLLVPNDKEPFSFDWIETAPGREVRRSTARAGVTACGETHTLSRDGSKDGSDLEALHVAGADLPKDSKDAELLWVLLPQIGKLQAKAGIAPFERRKITPAHWEGDRLIVPPAESCAQALTGYGKLPDAAGAAGTPERQEWDDRARVGWGRVCEALSTGDHGGAASLYFGEAIGLVLSSRLRAFPKFKGRFKPRAYCVNTSSPDGGAGKSTMSMVGANALGDGEAFSFQWGSSPKGLMDVAPAAGALPLVFNELDSWAWGDSKLESAFLGSLEGKQVQSSRTKEPVARGGALDAGMISTGNRPFTSVMKGELRTMRRVLEIPAPLTNSREQAMLLSELAEEFHGWPIQRLMDGEAAGDVLYRWWQEADDELRRETEQRELGAALDAQAAMLALGVVGARVVDTLTGGTGMWTAALAYAHKHMDGLQRLDIKTQADELLDLVHDAIAMNEHLFPRPANHGAVSYRGIEGWVAGNGRGVIFSVALESRAKAAGFSDTTGALKALRKRELSNGKRVLVCGKDGQLVYKAELRGVPYQNVYVFEHDPDRPFSENTETPVVGHDGKEAERQNAHAKSLTEHGDRAFWQAENESGGKKAGRTPKTPVDAGDTGGRSGVLPDSMQDRIGAEKSAEREAPRPLVGRAANGRFVRLADLPPAELARLLAVEPVDRDAPSPADLDRLAALFVANRDGGGGDDDNDGGGSSDNGGGGPTTDNGGGGELREHEHEHEHALTVTSAEALAIVPGYRAALVEVLRCRNGRTALEVHEAALAMAPWFAEPPVEPEPESIEPADVSTSADVDTLDSIAAAVIELFPGATFEDQDGNQLDVELATEPVAEPTDGLRNVGRGCTCSAPTIVGAAAGGCSACGGAVSWLLERQAPAPTEGPAQLEQKRTMPGEPVERDPVERDPVEPAPAGPEHRPGVREPAMVICAQGALLEGEDGYRPARVPRNAADAVELFRELTGDRGTIMLLPDVYEGAGLDPVEGFRPPVPGRRPKAHPWVHGSVVDGCAVGRGGLEPALTWSPGDGRHVTVLLTGYETRVPELAAVRNAREALAAFQTFREAFGGFGYGPSPGSTSQRLVRACRSKAKVYRGDRALVMEGHEVPPLDFTRHNYAPPLVYQRRMDKRESDCTHLAGADIRRQYLAASPIRLGGGAVLRYEGAEAAAIFDAKSGRYRPAFYALRDPLPRPIGDLPDPFLAGRRAGHYATAYIDLARWLEMPFEIVEAYTWETDGKYLDTWAKRIRLALDEIERRKAAGNLGASVAAKMAKATYAQGLGWLEGSWHKNSEKDDSHPDWYALIRAEAHCREYRRLWTMPHAPIEVDKDAVFWACREETFAAACKAANLPCTSQGGHFHPYDGTGIVPIDAARQADTGRLSMTTAFSKGGED
jgi:hypothetical protein